MSVVPGPSSEDFKEQVRLSTDIVRLIDETTKLIPNGRTFKGLCPFHDDHNPSFTVSPERQYYRCWSCGKSGDCFSFVMDSDTVSFPEALEYLARRAGLEMPAKLRRGPGESSEKQTLCELLEWAENEFHHCLLSHAVAERARKYLSSRGFNQKSIQQFKLGYHPDSWEWLLQRAKGRFQPEMLVRASLANKRDSGEGFVDRFVDRVMFPIHNERGQTVAFGGRILPDSTGNTDAKYLNSSETPVFSKSRICYALNIARKAIKDTGTALVMEGYADCVKAHQGGIHNAVATLGTALTDTHVTILKRLARKVVLVFDGDDPGRKAAEKAIPRFLSQDVDMRILTLPDELDPDEFVNERGGDALLKLADEAPEALEYQLALLTARYGTQTVDGRQQVLDGMLNLLKIAPGLEGSLKETIILGRLPHRLGLPEIEIRRRLEQLRKATPAVVRKVVAGNSSDDAEQQRRRRLVDSLQQNSGNDEKLDCELLQLIFTHPELTHAVRREIGPDDLCHEALREILSIWFDLQDEGDPTFGRLLSRVDCVEQKRLIVWIEESSPTSGAHKNLKSALGAGTETAEQALKRVIERLKWRRTCANHQASKSLLLERPSETAKLTEESRALLEQAARFHRERTAK